MELAKRCQKGEKVSVPVSVPAIVEFCTHRPRAERLERMARKLRVQWSKGHILPFDNWVFGDCVVC